MIRRPPDTAGRLTEALLPHFCHVPPLLIRFGVRVGIRNLHPVLDDDKYHWNCPDEVEKVLRHGEG